MAEWKAELTVEWMVGQKVDATAVLTVENSAAWLAVCSAAHWVEMRAELRAFHWAVLKAALKAARKGKNSVECWVAH